MNLLDAPPGLIAIVIVLIVGSAARLTRFVTADSLLLPFRVAVNRKAKAKLGRKVWTWFDDLINCPWCVGLWISIGCGYVGILWWSNRFVLGGMVALTASWIAANVQIREPE